MPLPTPRVDGGPGLAETLAARRSGREFAPTSLTRAEVGQLLWAAQGVTGEDEGRTAPSAGGLYPLEVHLVGADGVLHYLPAGHRVAVTDGRDLRDALGTAASGQTWVAEAPVVLVVVGVEARTRAKYGDRAPRYVALEAGHAAQNVLLQATAMGLVATPVGAFDDDEVARLLALPSGHAALELIPVGHPPASSSAPAHG